MGRVDISVRRLIVGLGNFRLGIRPSNVPSAVPRLRGSFCLVVLSFLISGVMGCGESGGGGGGDPSPRPPDPFAAARISADEADCECRATRGLVDDVDQCVADSLPSMAEFVRCIRDLSEQGRGVAENLDCAIGLEDELAACLNQSSCSEAEFNLCFDAYYADYAGCPFITEASIRDLNDCF